MSYSNAMIGHLWAQQTKERAKSSNGNLRFEGPTLYSYSTPIGRFVEAPKKRGTVVLITSRIYSATTGGKHVPALHRGIEYGRNVETFTVPNIGNKRFFTAYADSALSAESHAGNLAHLAELYTAGAQRAARAALHSWHAPSSEAELAKELESYAAKATRYAKLFGLRAPKFDAAKLAREVMAKRAEREALHNTPAEIAKRAKAAERREALAARKAELAQLEGAERIDAWRRGEPIRLRYGDTRDSDGALLRVKGNTLETSQGVKVPLAEAIRVFRFVKLIRERGDGSTDVAWQRNGASVPVGHFQVDRIMANGSFRAGCHLIQWTEIEAAARIAGVIDCAPSDEAVVSTN